MMVLYSLEKVKNCFKLLLLGLLEHYTMFSMLPVRATVRVTGHKTPGESSVILQLVVMIQLTSRRILRD